MIYTRLCLMCGREVPASHPRHEPLPECVGPDGMAGCLFDMTAEEAWQFWRDEAHRLREELRNANQILNQFAGKFAALEAEGAALMGHGHTLEAMIAVAERQYAIRMTQARQELEAVLAMTPNQSPEDYRAAVILGVRAALAQLTTAPEVK